MNGQGKLSGFPHAPVSADVVAALVSERATGAASGLARTIGAMEKVGAAIRRSALRRLICATVAVFAAGFGGSNAQAQPKPAFSDTIAQRMVACTACHGKEGRATNDGYYPRIAGKPAGYLYNQLVNFRDGRRQQYPLMTYMVAHLSDDYLREIAVYFAGENPPYPPPQSIPVSQSVMERGRVLVLSGDPLKQLPACAACHGRSLTGVSPAIPGLLGLPRDYLNGQFGAWRSGARRAAEPDCMGQIAGRMTVEDISAASAWLASQPVPPNAGSERVASEPLPMKCGSVLNAAR